MLDDKTVLQLFEEITKIRQLLEILAKDKLKKEIESVATTFERKKCWNLMDGNNNTNEIAEKVNISQRAVQRFIKELQEKDLVITIKRAFYKRKYDFLFPA